MRINFNKWWHLIVILIIIIAVTTLGLIYLPLFGKIFVTYIAVLIGVISFMITPRRDPLDNEVKVHTGVHGFSKIKLN